MNKLVLRNKKAKKFQSSISDSILTMDSTMGFELVTIQSNGNSTMECKMGSVDIKWIGGNFNRPKNIVSSYGIKNYFFQIQLTFPKPLKENMRKQVINKKVNMRYTSFSGADYVDDFISTSIDASIRGYSILFNIEMGGRTGKDKNISQLKFVFVDLLYEMVDKDFDSETLAYFFNKKVAEIQNNPMKIVTI